MEVIKNIIITIWIGGVFAERSLHYALVAVHKDVVVPFAHAHKVLGIFCQQPQRDVLQGNIRNVLLLQCKV